LLGNHYGAAYTNSERAFVEEWKASIDTFSQIFTGVTLTLTMGTLFPLFDVPAGSPELVPAPGFEAVCGGTTPPIACAAVTSILAYFSNPSVGGNNAKATQEDYFAARTPVSVQPNEGSVKWLSALTKGGRSSVPGASVHARVLGGLQTAASIVDPPECDEKDSKCGPNYGEQQLYATFQRFFAGTAAGATFGRPTDMNGTVTVSGAPINYLQIYWTDLLYAAGLGDGPGCDLKQLTQWLMTKKSTSKVPAACTQDVGSRSITVNGQVLHAQDILNLGRQWFAATAEEATPPVEPPPPPPHEKY
jgi:hypothetical protein